MTEDEKKLTAYHENGHALVSFNMPSYDPIHVLPLYQEEELWVW